MCSSHMWYFFTLYRFDVFCVPAAVMIAQTRQPLANATTVVNDACAVAKDHAFLGSRNAAAVAAVMEPEGRGCKDLANQRSLSDKIDLSVHASSGMSVISWYTSLVKY